MDCKRSLCAHESVFYYHYPSATTKEMIMTFGLERELAVRRGVSFCLQQVYRQIFNIRGTKSHILNVSCLVLHLPLSNPLKPGIKSIMKMYLEQRRHLNDQQFYCLLGCDLYYSFCGITKWRPFLSRPHYVQAMWNDNYCAFCPEHSMNFQENITP